MAPFNHFMFFALSNANNYSNLTQKQTKTEKNRSLNRLSHKYYVMAAKHGIKKVDLKFVISFLFFKRKKEKDERKLKKSHVKRRD